MNVALVICGRIGSGKSTAVGYVASEFDCKVVSFGRYVASVAKGSSSPRREVLQNLGNTLFRTGGAEGLLEGALQFAGVTENDSVVFDGVRHSEILAEIRRRSSNALAIYLEASSNERYMRHRHRQENSEMTFEDFEFLDKHPVEEGISHLHAECDLIVDATLPLKTVRESLLSNIHSWLKAASLPDHNSN